MKKIVLTISLITASTVTLTGCGESSTLETYDEKPAIHFDTGYILSTLSDNLIYILGHVPLIDSQDTTTSTDVDEIITELKSRRTDNDMYLSELEGLQHKEPDAEEYKNLVIEYLQEQNLYIDGTFESIKSGSTDLPDETYMQELGSLANEQMSDFRYEVK